MSDTMTLLALILYTVALAILTRDSMLALKQMRELAEELHDKLQYLFDNDLVRMTEAHRDNNGDFTFPDGDTWRKEP